ncbi:MAG: hypothetical protein ACRENQ_14255, partial [Gemmatimonadaceae bacterium]
FQDAANQFVSTWWAVIFPGIAIVATVLAFNTLGDALRDVLAAHQLPGPPATELPEPAHG